ncbi:calmodulin-like isoform X2 [Mya arenaria]|nr:calmodulin-like isoform X2 [Mya arenaria]
METSFPTEHYEVFLRYDRGGRGRMLVTDVPEAFLALGHNPTEKELVALIDSIPREDGRDYFDFPEFLTLLACHLQALEPEDRLRTAFRVFDKDGNGRVNAAELRTTMTILGERLSEADVEFMVRTADMGGDGHINYEEFIRVMTSK